MKPSLKRRVYELIDFVPHGEGQRPKLDAFDAALIALILANVVLVIVETVLGSRPGGGGSCPHSRRRRS